MMIMETPEGNVHRSSRNFFPSQRHVTYICGSCGYNLNLSSSDRNTATISSGYGKSIKRGIISFIQIDESRFTQADEFQCRPYFISKHAWGFFRPKTKFLCRKCGAYIGDAYNDHPPRPCAATDGASSSPSRSSSSVTESSTHRRYYIRIRSLQPSSVDESGSPVVM